MMQNNKKTSLLVPYQLPAYIREDPSYNKFVLFLQTYYEWLEQQGGVQDYTQNLLDYNNVDKTTSEFVDYFYNQFLPHLPKEILIDKTKAIKYAREMYQSKGTPASYKFLFRILYNTDVEFFYTKDAVLRASSGKWYVARSLKLLSSDTNFLAATNLRVFGETTKSLATVENVILASGKIEVFISDIERLFQSGEYIRLVDNNNQDVYFLNGKVSTKTTPGAKTLRAKIVGQISQIKINPSYRGMLYVPGDPVIVYGGLENNNDHGATAEIGETTSGSVQRIKVVNGGYGYTSSTDNGTTKTTINFTNLNSGARSPYAHIGGLDPAGIANVTFICNNTIGMYGSTKIGAQQYNFPANTSANLNCSFANALSFLSFSTYPITSIVVDDGGGGLLYPPTVSASSLYHTDQGLDDLKNIGILSPIQILNGGSGYVANDKIVFSGGSGYGAYANVLSVGTGGVITSVGYVYPSGEVTHKYPLGGMGYKTTNLPALTVSSSNVSAYGASLSVSSVLGDGAGFYSELDRVGTISTINVLDNGEDYISAPNVSFKVQDILVSNVSLLNVATKGDIVYQGANVNVATYMATVDSTITVLPGAGTTGVYILRVYNYTSKPNNALPLKIDSRNLNLTTTNSYIPQSWLSDSRYNADHSSDYMLSYGDGTAKGTATFLNGLVISNGQYLDETGQPSSYSVLQSEYYNDFTYEITLEKEIEKYRKTLMELLHPAGMKVIGRYNIKSEGLFDTHALDALDTAYTLAHYTGLNSSTATLYTSISGATSNNILAFSGLGSGANISTFISPSSTLKIYNSNGKDFIYSEVTSVNYTANTVTLKDNVWTTFANVATVMAKSGNTVINITSLTGSYNIVNGGAYSNTMYPLMDIIRVGDTVSVSNNTSRTVSNIDYINNTITLNSALTSSGNGYITVNRTYLAYANGVQIFGPVGIQYIPELTTEDGYSITTETGVTLVVG